MRQFIQNAPWQEQLHRQSTLLPSDHALPETPTQANGHGGQKSGAAVSTKRGQLQNDIQSPEAKRTDGKETPSKVIRQGPHAPAKPVDPRINHPPAHGSHQQLRQGTPQYPRYTYGNESYNARGPMNQGAIQYPPPQYSPYQELPYAPSSLPRIGYPNPNELQQLEHQHESSHPAEDARNYASL